MNKDQMDAIIRYLAEERRHYLALAANTERLLNLFRGAPVASEQQTGYNNSNVTYTPPMEYKNS